LFQSELCLAVVESCPRIKNNYIIDNILIVQSLPSFVDENEMSPECSSGRKYSFKGKSGSSDVLPMVTIYPLLYAIDIPLIDIMFSISFEPLDHPSRMLSSCPTHGSE
jgi:hypothetical protein